MVRREALNVAGVCDRDDRFNCKYCQRAGHDCEGATSTHRRFPYPGTIGVVDVLYDIYLGKLKFRELTGEELIEWDEPPYYIDNGVAIELPGLMNHVTLWRYHYSDGTSEDVLKRERIK